MALPSDSCHPISLILLFKKTLSQTDINHRLAFPTKWLELFLYAAQIEVWDELSQKLRYFMCRIRDGKHPKPVLTSGWRRFVKENKLKVGDTIFFFKQVDDDHRARFQIHVERANTNIESAAVETNSGVVSLRKIVSHEKSSTSISMDGVDTTLKLSLN